MTHGRGSVVRVDMGSASGWNVWPLENGEWAWRTWIAANGGMPRSGIEASEFEAQDAAQRALEYMLSDASAAAQDRRELSAPDNRGAPWDPQC
jgi:hypothetical protein